MKKVSYYQTNSDEDNYTLMVAEDKEEYKTN